MFTVRLRILWNVKQQKFMNEWIWWTDEKVELVFNRFMLPESLTSAPSFKAKVVFIHSRCVFMWCLVVLNKIFSLFASLVTLTTKIFACASGSQREKINSTVKDSFVGLPAEIDCSRDKIQRLGARSQKCWMGTTFLIDPSNKQQFMKWNRPLFTVNRCVYVQSQMQKHAPTHTGSANEGRKCVF